MEEGTPRLVEISEMDFKGLNVWILELPRILSGELVWSFTWYIII